MCRGQSPGKTHRAGLSRPATPFAGEKGGNRCQVIRVGGVPQAQRHADKEYDPEGRRPVQEPSSQPSIVAIPSPFLHTTSHFRPAMRIRLTRQLGSQTLHFQIVSKASCPQHQVSNNVRAP